MKFFEYLKKTKEKVKELETKESLKKYQVKTTIFTLFVCLLILVPFIILFVELFKQYSSVTTMFYVLIVLAGFLAIIYVPVFSVVYYHALQTFLENEEFLISKKELFIAHFFSILNLAFVVICVCIVLIFNYIGIL